MELVWSPSKETVFRLISRAKRSVDLAVAYMSRAMVSDLLAALPDGVQLRAIARLDGEDFCSGIVDPKALRLLNTRVRVMRNLHAKLYIVDERVAIAGSANLTKQGLSFNQEAGLLIEDAALLKKMCSRYSTWWKQSAPVKHDALAALAKKLPRTQRGSSRVRSAVSRMAPVVGAAAQRATRGEPEPAIRFQFQVGRAFLNPAYGHPITIPTRYFYRAKAEQLDSRNVRILGPDDSSMDGSIYSSGANWRPFYQIRVRGGYPGDPLSRLQVGASLDVEVLLLEGAVQVRLRRVG